MEPRPFVLMVDDDRPISRLVVDVLEAKGFAAASASNFEQAALIVRGRDPDLILLDVRLRARYGPDEFRLLRALYDLKGIPVVLVSAMNRDELETLAARIGCDGVLTKPFGLGELLDCVRHWMAARMSAAAE